MKKIIVVVFSEWVAIILALAVIEEKEKLIFDGRKRREMELQFQQF